MKTRRTTKGEDQSQIALRTVEATIGGPLVPKTTRERAVELIGADAMASLEAAGLAIVDRRTAVAAGGKARAATLSKRRRIEIAKNAARSRWEKNKAT